MQTGTSNLSDESGAMRRAMRDLVSLSALPAVWVGYSPQEVLASLCEVLLAMLPAEFICVRPTASERHARMTIARTKHASELDETVLAKLIDEQLSGTGQRMVFSTELVRNGTIYLAAVDLDPSAHLGSVVAGSLRRDFPTETERLLLQVGANHAAVVIQQRQSEMEIRAHTARLHQLAKVAAAIGTARDTSTVSHMVTDCARTLLAVHQAVSSLTRDQKFSQAIHSISLSDKYAAWRTYDAKPDGSGIYALVCKKNRPMRLTQAELLAHPDWRGFGVEAKNHPPLRGWLAVPFVASNGGNLGLIQVSDKYDGTDFTEDDESILVQLASVASVAFENIRLYEELKEIDRRKDEFLATLAHELRNPLAPVRNSLQIMQRAGPNFEVIDQARQTIDRQVSQMIRLVDDLLDVSRITKGKVELRKGIVELATILKDAIETSRPLIEEAGHELNVALPPERIWLDADSMRMSQVISNVLNNAAKYTPNGGKIELSAERYEQHVVINVSDNGIGIPPEMLHRVFEMFAQVDTTLERAHGGLGIGLTLVKRLVEMHGGTVTANSGGRGCGSRFVVRLPVAAEDLGIRSVRTKSDSQIETEMGGRRILVVDDNVDSAESLAMLVKLMGNEFRVAHDGASALRIVKEYRPHVVFLDIGMPKMNGYEVAREIRKDPELQNIVLVALTGWGQEEDRRRSQEAGFDEHLTKPADAESLERMLSSFRDRTSM